MTVTFGGKWPGIFSAKWRLPGREAGRRQAAGGDLGDVLVDGGAADAEQPGDGGDGVVRPGQQVAGVADLLGGHGRRPPEARAAAAGGVQALAGALDDQLADELGQRGEDVEDQPAAGGGGVQGLVQALEPDPAPAQRGDDRDQVGQRPGQPVQARHDQGVAGPQVVQAGGQLGPVSIFAGQLVGEDAEAARLGQGVLLAVEQLAGGADPGVADQRAGPDGRFRGEKVAGGFGGIGWGSGHIPD